MKPDRVSCTTAGRTTSVHPSTGRTRTTAPSISSFRLTSRQLLGSALIGAALLGLPLARSAAAGAGQHLSYPEAVQNTRLAAEAVLDRAGAETCLRGKLTKALLGLSNSCEAAGERSPLCALADKVVVITPLTMALMDATARQLLELSAPTTATSAAPSAIPPSATP